MQYRILAVTIWSSIIGNLEFCIADDLANRYTGNLAEIQASPRKQIVEPSHSRKFDYKNALLDQPLLYEVSTTTERLTFEQDELSDRFPTPDAIYFRQTEPAKENLRNDTGTNKQFVTDELQFLQDSDNFGQRIRILVPEGRSTSASTAGEYETSSVSYQGLKEINNKKKENEASDSKIPVRKNFSKSWQVSTIVETPKNNVSIGNSIRIRDGHESTIASGVIERTSEKPGLNLDEKLFERIDETINSERHDFTLESDDNLSTSSSHTSQGKLSGPIIVPDFLHFKKSNPIGESIDANRTEALSSASTLDYPGAGENSEIQDVIRSALVLNPLRVGVALVNAKENTLIDDDSEGSQSINCIVTSSTVQTEANTVDEEGATNNDESSAKACSNTINGYKQFSKQSEGALPEEDPSKKKTSEGVVEIQKSIEIYHSAPVQEIHYPVELAPPIRQIENNLYRRSKINDAIGLESFQRDDQLAGVISQSRKPISVDTSEGVPKKNLNFPYVSMGLYLSSDKRVEANGLNSLPPQQSNAGNNLGIPILLLPGQTQDATSYGQYTDPGNIFSGITMVAGGTNNKHQTPNNFKSDKENHYVINTQEERSGTSQYHPFQRVVQNNQFPLIETRYILPISPPYSVSPKKSNEKPGYGSHTTEIESMDNKLSYQVERIVEKQPSLAQQLIVHAQVPYDKQTVDKQARLQDPYPFYFEKTGEKKIPQSVHRFIMQPYPVHVRIPSVSVEKIVPDHLEKVVKQTRKSHPIEAGKHTENVKPHSEEIDKLFHPSQVHRSLQKLYAEVASIPFHGNYVNSSSIHDHVRKKPSFYFEESTTGYNNKNGYFNYLEQSSNPVLPKEQLAPLGNLRGYRRRARILEKDRTPKNKYMDIVDSRQASNSFRMQLKSSPFFLVEARQPNVPGISKNARQSDGYPPGDIGNFRQSKVEYGFKPPMIPSIQYDEQTASKVDNN